MQDTALQILVFVSIVSFVLYAYMKGEEKKKWVESFFTMDRLLIQQKLKTLQQKLTILDKYMVTVRGAGSKISPIDLLVRVLICGVTAGVAAYMATSYMPTGIAGIAGGVMVPYLYYSGKKEKRRAAMARQLSPMLKQMANYLRAGCSKIQALEKLHASIPEPLGEIIGNIIARVNTGEPLVKAFEDEGIRVPLFEFKVLTVLIIIHSEIGGKLEDSLDNLAKTMDAKRELSQTIDSQTQETKLGAYITAAVPTALYLLFRIVSPEYLEQLTKHQLGQIGLMLSFLMIVLGIVVIRKISQVNIDQFYR